MPGGCPVADFQGENDKLSTEGKPLIIRGLRREGRALPLAMSETGVGMQLDINEIQKYLPHRYPFLLIDKVVEMERYKRIVAIKCVTINEGFFQGHFPGKPVMPGDQLRIEVNILTWKGDLCKIDAKAFVDGNLATEAKMLCVMADREEPANS